VEEREQRGQAVLRQSQQFGAALAEALGSDDLDRRELVSWKLLAAAAYDLSVAGDLFEAEATGPQTATTRRASSTFATAPELKEVLEAPLGKDMRDLAQPATRAALPKDPKAAKDQLEKTIATFLDEIPDAAANLSQTAVSGAVTVGLLPAQQAVSVLVQELLARLPDVTSPLVRHAAQIVAEALRKLQATLGGTGVQQQLQEEVSGWLKDIQENRDTVTSLLDKLYEMERIGLETRGLLPEDPSSLPAERYNQATKTLEELLARYSKTQKVLSGVMRVLAYVKNALLPAVPWGPIGVYGTYTGVLAYAIFSGGDYLDWYRLGDRAWLDRVGGLRTTVSKASRSRSQRDGRHRRTFSWRRRAPY
jgi:hypothetical protein